MSTYLGLDIGTSAVKAVLCDDAQRVLAQGDVPLVTARPQPLWSEQDPESWWQAAQAVVDTLAQQAPAALRAVAGIGLCGQMHGATLLDEADRPLRAAILWNDGRSHEEASELHARLPDLASRLGVVPMPGLTAPKLLWLHRHEPATFARVRTVLLPKDYVTLRLTGERVTEMSDAAGTWWLDQARRDWSDEALAATHLDRSQMPRLLEGTCPAGVLRRELAARWGMGRVIVAGGGGDAAAGAVGLGATEDGAAFVSLGTSGQLFAATRAFKAAPATLVHAFCHAVPERWFQMGAMLNGASCLAWGARLLGGEITALLDAAERAYAGPSSLLFLPYLTGERTPHNDPHAKGVLLGLTPETDRAQVVQAILEGVAFGVADAKASLEASGTSLSAAGVIGGGARSRFWLRILADVLDMRLMRYAGADNGPAFGAARLGRLAASGEAVAAVCVEPAVEDIVTPEPRQVAAYRPRLEAFRRVYGALRSEFRRD